MPHRWTNETDQIHGTIRCIMVLHCTHILYYFNSLLSTFGTDNECSNVQTLWSIKWKETPALATLALRENIGPVRTPTWRDYTWNVTNEGRLFNGYYFMQYSPAYWMIEINRLWKQHSATLFVFRPLQLNTTSWQVPILLSLPSPYLLYL